MTKPCPDVGVLRGWSVRWVQARVRDAIRRNRAAWNLVPSLRDAIIAREYASIAAGLDKDLVSSLHLATLWTDFLEAADLL